VFGPQGEGVKHIPADLQGVLGTARPAIRAALKQQLKTAFLKS
jgi:hypothetical protein